MHRHHKINYIEFVASDLEATEAFFKKLFGWSFTYYGPDYMDFNDGVLSGGFYRASMRASYEEGAPLMVFYSDDLEQSYAEVIACGGTICKEIFNFPGGRRFHFCEPSGNELAIWQESTAEPG
ncbi:VOC family protein [Agaribacterium haliotis]|uniref:VOC family protein n=1 Tax=Agaribacterium haliotis TaxID=2013869 RepID=UPI000BB5606C|nr:VOC family protein [Agaribacterium haliotis]